MTGREIPKRQPWDIVKSKIRVKITQMEKIEAENSAPTHKIISTEFTNMSGKDFKATMQKDYVEGADNRVEIVDSAPEKFKFNCVYIRRDGKVAWIYTTK